jgi:hypothetical protein
LLARVTAAEIYEQMAYAELEPFGHPAADFYAARQAFYAYHQQPGVEPRQMRAFTWEGMTTPESEPDWDDPETIMNLLGAPDDHQT